MAAPRAPGRLLSGAVGHRVGFLNRVRRFESSRGYPVDAAIYAAMTSCYAHPRVLSNGPPGLMPKLMPWGMNAGGSAGEKTQNVGLRAG